MTTPGEPAGRRPVKLRALTNQDTTAFGITGASAFYRSRAEVENWLTGLPLSNSLGLFEGDDLVSALLFSPFRCAFGGNWVPMGGVGAVGTRVDRQGKGYAGLLLRESLRAMRRRGYPVSILFPFSYRFYRKYGWELGGTAVDYHKLKPSEFKLFPEADSVSIATPADVAQMTRCYNEFALAHNGMAARTAAGMRKRYRIWLDRKAQIYVVRNASGTAGPSAIEGWVVEIPERKVHTATVTVPEMVYTTQAALRALIGFLGRSPALVEDITFRAPSEPSLIEYLVEPRVDMRIVDAYQFRLVDVAKALSLRGYPVTAGARTLVLDVTDDVAHWNSKRWALEVRNGKGSVRTTDQQPDISLDQRRLAQLFCGALGADDLFGRVGVVIENPAAVETVRALFDRRAPFILEQF